MGYHEYMNARQQAFMLYHASGYECACAYIGCQPLTVCELAGLNAELDFYHEYRMQYSLTLAADSGDSCDFSGQINGTMVRIDVTTNIDYKSVLHYTKAACRGFDYVIAERRKGAKSFTLIYAWELDGVLSPCGCSRPSIPYVVLFPEGTSRCGSPDGWNRVALLSYCPVCGEVCELRSSDDVKIQMLSSYYNDAYDFYYEQTVSGCEDEVAQAALRNDYRNYLKQVYHYLKHVFEGGILAIGEYTYIVTDHRGDGFWGVKMVEKSPCVERFLPSELPYKGELIM